MEKENKRLINMLSKLLCKMGVHDWSNGPGEPCYKCGTEDEFWKEPSLPKLPEWSKEGIVSTLDFSFCFKDRLKILFRKNIRIKNYVACENNPGRIESINTEFFVVKN
jgi:hypothetical protein